MVRSLFGVTLLALSVGCSNHCQDLCSELADYATECGISVNNDELSDCKSTHQRRDLGEGELEICEDFKDPDTIREEWTCDDLEEYWDATAAR